MTDFCEPAGITFYPAEPINPALASKALCRVVSLLQRAEPHDATLEQIEDWRDHDGLIFLKRTIVFRDLFAMVETPRALFEATPNDESVFVGVLPRNKGWYLRFRVEWDADDEYLTARFEVTVAGDLTNNLSDCLRDIDGLNLLEIERHSVDMKASCTSPPLLTLLLVWLLIGLQSFGGGVATLALVRRAAVDEHGWLTDGEFAQEWALCQVAPGINLLALTVLIGRRLAGARGIVVALFGLLLPSVIITVLLSAAFADVERHAAGQAVLRGILPGTVGLGLITALDMARPALAASRRKGARSQLFTLTLLIGSGLALAFLHVPVMLILFSAGLISAFAHWRQRALTKGTEPEQS